MVSVSRTFTVDRPVDEVVAYLADFANAEEWDPGTVSCKQVSAGQVAVGTIWHNTSKIAGITTELEYTLEDLSPGKIVLVGRNKTATSTDTITVVAKGAGSEVTYDAHVELNGIAKLGAPAVRLVFEHLGNETEDGIKKAVARL